MLEQIDEAKVTDEDYCFSGSDEDPEWVVDDEENSEDDSLVHDDEFFIHEFDMGDGEDGWSDSEKQLSDL